MPAPKLVLQTMYSELLERCETAAFSRAFPAGGSFTSKTVKGRRYWYFQMPTATGRGQLYVGPETPKILEQIDRHRQSQDDSRERRALVSTLVRSLGLPRLPEEVGRVVAALSAAGVFRLRAVLVGAIAYQTYAAMLGARLPRAATRTGDIDIAQDRNISIAVGEETPPMLDVLRMADPSFRPVPHTADKRRVTAYAAASGLRVDFLAPNTGAESDTPTRLRALHTDAQPLRFLDYLIQDAQPAVVLHESGTLVQVPSPERFAVHKLIVARRRKAGTAKSGKDLEQSATLLDRLAASRPRELNDAWEEAFARGKKWQTYLLEGLAGIDARIRDIVLRTIGRPRNVIPGLSIGFQDSPPRYDLGGACVRFSGLADGSPVGCSVSGEVLRDYFGAAGMDRDSLVHAFLEHRSVIEEMTRIKYLDWPVEEPETAVLTGRDTEKLRKAVMDRGKARPQSPAR